MARTSGIKEAPKSAKDEFRLKWHRARLMEQGLSRAAVARKISEMQKQKKLPNYGMIKGDSGPLHDSSERKSKPKGSPYSRWANQSGKKFQSDNGKSPYQNWVNGGGAKRVTEALTLNNSERQKRYAENRKKNGGGYRSQPVQIAEPPAKAGLTRNGVLVPYRSAKTIKEGISPAAVRRKLARNQKNKSGR